MTDPAPSPGEDGGVPVFTATLSSVPGAQLISVAGELDLGTAELLEARLGSAVQTGGLIVVDLSCCDYIDSTGLTVVLRAHERARERSGSQLRVVAAADGHVRDMLRLTAMDQALAVHEDLTAALPASSPAG